MSNSSFEGLSKKEELAKRLLCGRSREKGHRAQRRGWFQGDDGPPCEKPLQVQVRGRLRSRCWIQPFRAVVRREGNGKGWGQGER